MHVSRSLACTIQPATPIASHVTAFCMHFFGWVRLCISPVSAHYSNKLIMLQDLLLSRDFQINSAELRLGICDECTVDDKAALPCNGSTEDTSELV